MKNKKGFTLIEIIAVIVILGVIMVIAIPSVSSMIMNSRKKTYLVAANRYIDGAKSFVSTNDLNLRDESITFYIPKKCLSMDKTQESPFGEWKDVYVAVTFDGVKYQYYYTSTDTAGMGISLTHNSKLKTSSIKANVTSVSTNVGVGSRPYIVVFANDCKLETSLNNNKKNATTYIVGEESTEATANGGKNYNITSLTSIPTNWTNTNVTLEAHARDVKNGIVAYTFTDIASLSSTTDEWININETKNEISYTHEVSKNGIYYFYTKDGSGRISKKSIRIYNIDKEEPECLISSNKTKFVCTDNNGIVKYYVGPGSTPAYINVAQTVKLTKDIELGGGSYNLYAVDVAGNQNGQSLNISPTDSTVPGVLITSTDNPGTSQTLTIDLSDDKALDKYYFGKTNPSNTAVTFQNISGSPKTATKIETITEAGTYYAAAKDKDGNIGVQSITFFTINATTNNSSYGTVSPAKQYIRQTGKATIKLAPKATYKYSSNNCGGVISSTNTLTINSISGNLNCTITFAPDTFTVTATSNDTNLGTVSPASQTVIRGNNATINLAQKDGYGYLSNNCGGVITSANVLTVKNVQSGTACTVNFTGNTFLVSATSNDTSFGTVSPAQQYIVKNGNATITLAPATGYKYKSNNCGGTVSGNTMTVPSVGAAKSCTIVFEKITYTVTAASNNNSFGTVNPTTQTVGYNASTIINLDPKIGYEYKSDTCGATVESPNVLKISNIIANKNCTVTFGLIEYTVNVRVIKGKLNAPHGSVSPSNLKVKYGSSAEFALTPDTGYYYISDTCGGSANSNSTKLTIPNVINNMSCDITMGKKPVEVKAVSNNTSWGTVSPAQQYTPYGELATIMIQPVYTYEYESNNCGATLYNKGELRIQNVTTPKNCTVKFKKRKKTISYDSKGGSACAAKTVDMGGPWGTLCSPTRYGYTFTRWENSNGQTVDANTIAWDNTSVNAVWTINRNTLVVNADGGSGGGSFTQEYTSTINISVSKSSHTFLGWSKSGDCAWIGGGSSFTYTYPGEKDTTCTITANWRWDPPPPPEDDGCNTNWGGCYCGECDCCCAEVGDCH